MRGLDLSLLVLAFLAVAVYLLVLLPVQIQLRYEGKWSRHSLLLRFQFWGGRIGFGTKFKFGQKPSRAGTAGQMGLIRATGIRLYTRLMRASRRHRVNSLEDFSYYYLLVRQFLKFTRTFLSHSKCKHFTWATSIGLPDYFDTGIAVGGLWSLKGYLLGHLSRYTKAFPPDAAIRVMPVYGRKHLGIQLECILETRSGHIMIQLMHFLLWWLSKGGGRSGRPSH